MRNLIFLFAIILAISPLCMGANFKDDFEDGDMEGWVVVDDPDELMSDKAPSTWEVQGAPINDVEDRFMEGKAVYQGSNRWGDPTDQIALGTYLIYDEAEFVDFIFEFDTVANDNDGLGCVWRWKDRLNHYRFMTVIDPGSRGPFRRIERRLGEDDDNDDEIPDGDGFPFYEFLAKSTESYSEATEIHIKVEVKGTKMTVYMDKELALTADDKTYDAGKIGFALYAEQAFFDNVEVTDLGGAVDPKDKLASKWGDIRSK